MTFSTALQNHRISLLFFCLVLMFVSTFVFNTTLYSQTTNIFAGKTYDAGISLGFVGSGEVDMDFDPYVTKRTSSFLVKGHYDSYLIPKLAMGLYCQVAAAPVDMHYTEHRTDSDYINDEWVYTEREIEHSYNLGVMTWEIGASI